MQSLITLQTDRSIAVNWKTTIPARGVLTVFGLPNKVGLRIVEKKAVLYHHAIVKNLMPGAVYAYRVDPDGLNEKKSVPVRFRMPFGRDALTFFVISDTHQVLPVPGISEYVKKRTNRVIKAMVGDTLSPDFFVNCGDHMEEKAFLFDEPLSNLDAKLRLNMREEIRSLHDRLQTTTIYVTHDQVEAMTLADRMAVMKEGRILQIGAPMQIYEHPINIFVAGFIGSPPMNLIECRSVQNGAELFLDSGAFRFPVSAIPKGMEVVSAHTADQIVLGIRPEDIEDREFASEKSRGGIFRTKISMVEPMGANVHLRLKLGDQNLIACVNSKTRARAGETIELVCDLSKAHLYDKETGALLA
ncbi:MAG: TOBE domain-containing protein [Deltaproteobacteria bacterium]|nr:TOBE domain-containing protein [Deltaproteobacteria bacterium]